MTCCRLEAARYDMSCAMREREATRGLWTYARRLEQARLAFLLDQIAVGELDRPSVVVALRGRIAEPVGDEGEGIGSQRGGGCAQGAPRVKET